MRRCPPRFVLASLAAWLVVCAPKRSAANPNAEAWLRQAEAQYIATNFDGAIHTVRGGIAACGPTGCSAHMLAKFYMFEGHVQAAGKKRLEDAKDAFKRAITLDPNVVPDPALMTSEVDFAYNKARREMGLHPVGMTAIGTSAMPNMPGHPSPLPIFADDDDYGDDDDDVQRNWITLWFGPDISLLSSEDDVCETGRQNDLSIVCARGDGSRYTGSPTLGNANNINGGPLLSTMRLHLGYDRLVTDNITVGVRVGYAFGGSVDGGATFLPLHAEARAAYWFGRDPFADRGLRGLVFLNAGLSQIDTQIDVQVVEDGTACGATIVDDINSPCTQSSTSDGRIEPRVQTVEANKQAGLGFAGAGLGVAYAPSSSFSMGVNVRFAITFPVITPVVIPEVGMGIGF